jgi:DNA polymerase III alpha subunit
MKFDCGCDIPDDQPIDFYNLRLDCPKTWEIFIEGRTQGVFQLETSLGKGWSKKVKPERMEHLAALTSVLRPGCINALVGDKTIAQHYADRKNGEEEIEYYHEALESILEETFGEMIYQEESLQITQKIAGFDLKEADQLRKAMGKKDAKIMAEVKTKFLEGAKKTKIVTEEQAEEIFSWIEKSNRYSFNKCLDRETLIETPNGLKKIKRINIGDKILAPNNKFVTVLDRFKTGTLRVYKYKFNSGEILNCTANHKLLCTDYIQRPAHEVYYDKHWVKLKHGISQIISYEYIGDKKTMDIEVDSDEHVFYANDVAVSNSHSQAYGTVSYWTAYVKAHFPLQFYTSWLYYSKDKPKPQREVRALVSDARRHNIDVCPPDLRLINRYDPGQFCIHDGKIYFGITNIKGIGDAQLAKVLDGINIIGENIEQWGWIDIVTKLTDYAGDKVMNGLIYGGALDYLKISRNRMVFDYNAWKALTKKEQEWARDNCGDKSIKERLEYVAKYRDKTNVRRKQKIIDMLAKFDKPGLDLNDTVDFINKCEIEYLGTPLTYSKLDACNTHTADTTCRQFLDGKTGKMSLGVEILRSSEYIIKKGENKGNPMGYLTVEDDTGVVDSVVVFSQAWEKHAVDLQEGNTVLLIGKTNFRNKETSFIVESAKLL